MTEVEQSRLLFVNYHYIREPASYRSPGIHPIGMTEFRAQIDQLKDRVRFAAPAEVEAFILDGRALPGPSVVLTFDDGLMDHWHAACEVLDPLGIKGAFFVCSRPAIAKRALTVHKVQWLRAHTNPSEFATEFFSLVPPELRPSGHETWVAQAERAYKYDTPLIARLKFALNFVLPGDLVDEVTSRMLANRGIDEAGFCERTYVSDAHLRSLADQGHVVGVHGHTHTPFSRLGNALLDDVATNVTYLTKAIGRVPGWVAYPYGRADAIPDDAVLNSLFRRFDLKIGLTLMGTWNVGGESPARLNRINTNELEAVMDAETSSGVRSALA
jgi:peptidoglycan/xylan/chitin deacetylase (PgdA/CDA1 family)